MQIFYGYIRAQNKDSDCRVCLYFWHGCIIICISCVNRSCLSVCQTYPSIDQIFRPPVGCFIRAPPQGGCPIVITLSVCPSVRLSVRLSVSKNFNIGHNFCTVRGRAFIFCMSVPCDKTFPLVQKFSIMLP